MTQLPAGYAWLAKEPGPRMLLEMLKIFGTVETPGRADNPVILEWARELGLETIYSHDEIPWCGLGMAIVAKRAGKELPAGPLAALNWLKFGTAAAVPMLGDIMVKHRVGGGHVTMYIGEDADHFHCMGGNQSDRVCIVRYDKTLGWSYRRPIYTQQPANVRRVMLAPGGAPAAGSEA